MRYRVIDPPSDSILEPGYPGLVRPDEPHLVEPLGPIKIQVEFYNQLPELVAVADAQRSASAGRTQIGIR